MTPARYDAVEFHRMLVEQTAGLETPPVRHSHVMSAPEITYRLLNLEAAVAQLETLFPALLADRAFYAGAVLENGVAPAFELPQNGDEHA